MKIFSEEDFAQKGDAWLQLRSGKITASNADKLLTPKFEIRKGEMPQTYLAQVLAERWTFGPLAEDEFSSVPTEFGSIIESFARPYFELVTRKTVKSVGFITTDDELCGCSPDGIIDEEAGLEIKCPGHKAHTKYLMTGEVPEKYLCQVHFSMFVTGFKKWHFMSYRHDMPPLICVVEWDEKIQAQIESAVEQFREKLNAGWECLLKLNGGRAPVKQKTVDEYAQEEMDVTP